MTLVSDFMAKSETRGIRRPQSAGLSVLGRFAGLFRARRETAARRAVYQQLLVEDECRLVDLGMTRLDVLRLIEDLDRS